MCETFSWDEDLRLEKCYDNCNATQNRHLSLELQHSGSRECFDVCPDSHPFN